jgi:transposase-like protein
MASPKRRGRSFWTPLVREYEQSSGITQKAFAQSHGVRTDTFRSWLYQLRREAAAADSQSTPCFVEVDTSRVHSSSQSVTLELGDVRVHLDALPEPGWLAELARQTGEARSC